MATIGDERLRINLFLTAGFGLSVITGGLIGFIVCFLLTGMNSIVIIDLEKRK